jgi:hypothetical protein
MSNVLDDEKQRQIVALGRLGWTLRRIEAATGVRRETVGGYLRAAGLSVRARGRPGEEGAKPAISAGKRRNEASAAENALLDDALADELRRHGYTSA